MRRKALLLALAAVSALGAAGCGRKGTPLPPVIRVAETTRDLSVVQRDTAAHLEWSFPQMTTAGGPLPDLEFIEVWRVEVPVAQEPRGTTQRDRQLRVNLIEARGEVVYPLKDEGLDRASHGAALVVEDELAPWLEAEDGGTVLLYAVRSVCCRGRPSEFSNVVRVVPRQPPASPQDIEVNPGVDGVSLSWTKIPGRAVRVERSDGGDRWLEASPEPRTEAAWIDTDAAQGATWFYRLRSVMVGADGAVTQVGTASPVLRVEYPDIYPPEKPTDLVCLPEGGRVRLRWHRGEGAAVYEIRRTGGGEKRVLAEKLTGVTFVDENPPVGTLDYLVRSVDEAGNQSEAVRCSTVVEDSP